MTARASASQTEDRELVIMRLFDAPRSLVFKAWTEPEHMMRWIGPQGFEPQSVEMDARPGGTYRSRIRSPEGKDSVMTGLYKEVVAPERLVFSFAWEDENGKPGHETMVSLTFAEAGGKTKLTFHQAMFETVESRNNHQSGWNSSFDRLEAYLRNASGRAV